MLSHFTLHALTAALLVGLLAMGAVTIWSIILCCIADKGRRRVR